MSQYTAIRNFVNTVLGEYVVIPRNRLDNNFSMGLKYAQPRLYLPRNLNYEMDENDKAFRKDFVSRYSTAQGFANITITLLHECGHWATKDQGDMMTYGERAAKARNMKEYLLIKEERLATDWAIQWLYEPANRKIAKAFEKEYFKK